MNSQLDGKSIFLVTNIDYKIASHNMHLLKELVSRGADVTVLAGETGWSHVIENAGAKFIGLPIDRSGRNIYHESRLLCALTRQYREKRPDLVHHITAKPVIYGTIAAHLSRSIPVVNSITGLGYMFTLDDRASTTRTIALLMYRLSLRYNKQITVFQNPDDMEMFLRARVIDEAHTSIIYGAGVDCREFFPTPEPEGDCLVILPSRMLYDKGIGEFVHAARILHERELRARFALVGDVDESNPTSIGPEQIRAWEAEGIVEWWGHRSDMAHVMSECHIVVLPSYREGVPKVLLEAAASGKPIVTTDVPGCREVAFEGINALLVPPRDGAALADAILALLKDRELRLRFGLAGRSFAEEKFDCSKIIKDTLHVYSKALAL